MRKAILILGLIFMLIVLVQSWLVGIGGTMFNDRLLSLGGVIGRLVGILFGAGAAFVLAKPLIAMFIFLAGGLLGVIFGLFTGYYDMILWGGISLVLGAGSYFARDTAEKMTVPEEKIREVSQF